MPLRQCLDCPALATSGPRCSVCKRAHQAAKDAKRPERRTYSQQERRRQAVAQHVATYGLWCPGAHEVGHNSHASDDLTADHLTPVALGGREDGPLRVLCRSANSSRGAHPRAQPA
jgi:5-methylcytosine-specific restriction protein A